MHNERIAKQFAIHQQTMKQWHGENFEVLKFFQGNKLYCLTDIVF